MNSTKVAMFLSLFSMLHVGFLPHTSATVLGANETDRLALLAFKSQIVHDPQGVLSSWNDSLHFCRWEGVICSHRHVRVYALNLPTRGLVGSLSPYIGNMSFLRMIRLPNNSFSGGIPPEIGRLFRLQFLLLHNNSLEGNIPANLSHCTNLKLLDLGRNKLVGKIPSSFSSLLMLKGIYIGPNYNLSGGIPPFIGNLTSLETISLANCHLGGSIPDVFHKLTSLRQLGLGENDLIGSVPSSIYNLSLLEILSLSQNHLEGRIPVSLPLTLPHLQFLELGANNFSGTLPPSISNFSELQIFDVSLNNFYGKVTINFGNLRNLSLLFSGGNNLGSGERDEMKFIDSLSNCSNLKILDISRNNFSGILPNSLGNFSTQLNGLVLSYNSLYGSLPSSIGHLSGLTLLGLDNNQFSGTIPLTIVNLQNLQKLSLGWNTFSGKIPDSLGNLSLLVQLGINNNKLEATIPLSLGNCHHLSILSLYRNNLSGSIPKQIFGLSSLSLDLNLGRNHLSGTLPMEVGNLKNLGQLHMGENNLSGELPSSLGSCTSLEVLNLSGNFFHGPIPTSLSSLRALQSLDLSCNNFSGVIPEYLAQAPLQYLNISFNNFEGEVPTKGVFANSSAISIVGNQKLCGGISELHLPICNLKHSKSKLSATLIVVISIGSTLAGLAMVTLFLFCWRKKKRQNQSIGLELKDSFFKISYEMLLKATNGFSSENLIGVGGFASVYKGILNGGDDDAQVAVKVLNLQQRGSLKSFVAECEALRHVRHRNLVKVITCCSSVDFQGNDFKALIYEFMPNGSLEQWLHSSPTTSNELQRLNLVQRIKIAIDVAFAVEYLHHRSEIRIVHCDLKPSNILLDEDMVAHVGDFGLTKFLHPEHSSAHASSTIRGTIGYAPPEYGLGNEVSAEGDVYSYGILLLEMVMGKKPTDPLFREGLNLHSCASMALANYRPLEVVEPILLNQNNGECLISMLKIGVACSMESPHDRMDISRVIRELHSLPDSINLSH